MDQAYHPSRSAHLIFQGLRPRPGVYTFSHAGSRNAADSPNHIVQRSNTALKGQIIKAQGWPQKARPTRGRDSMMQSTLKRVASIFNPFRVDIGWNGIPRVERHNAPLNPGL